MSKNANKTYKPELNQIKLRTSFKLEVFQESDIKESSKKILRSFFMDKGVTLCDEGKHKKHKKNRNKVQRFLTKGQQSDSKSPISPNDRPTNDNVSPIENIQFFDGKHNSLKQNTPIIQNFENSENSIDSRKLSIQMIEDEFTQDRRNSKLRKLNVDFAQFVERKDGTLTPMLIVPKTKRLSLRPVDVDNFKM